jgi:hypothetical protein
VQPAFFTKDKIFLNPASSTLSFALKGVGKIGITPLIS